MFDYKALDACLTHLADQRHLPGVSACIMGPNGSYTFSHGFRDAALVAPVDADTIYGVASMSKSITALCACILADEGKLDLDTPVSDFLPAFSMPGQPKEAATVRHLAMHRAGLPPMEPLEWSIAMNTPGRDETAWIAEMRRTAPNSMATLDQLLDYIAVCPPVSAPGEVMSYSNEGYALLSAVIDKAAGMPLEQFMQERVFDPLGMTRSVLEDGTEKARSLGNLTSLFEIENGKRTCDDAWSVLPPFRGCAMVKSTARDMAVYYRALSNMGIHEGRQVISAHAVDLLIGRYHPLSEHPVMCMGLYKREKAGHVFCEHAGALHGASAKGGLLLGEGYGFAVLCNQGDENMDAFLWAMYNAVLGLPLDTSHEDFLPSQRPFSAPQMIRGRYIGHEGVPSILCIRLEEDMLQGTRDGDAFTLCYCGGTRFLAVGKSGETLCKLEFLIRDGRAWGVRCGTRIFARD